MASWHLIHQNGDLPVSVGRDDGVSETPPAGLIRYIEMAYGAWTLEPATDPLGMEGIDWPQPCMWRDVTGCAGTLTYVEHVSAPVLMAETGETVYPAGWQCDVCGNTGGPGLHSLTIDHDPAQ
jgi:hypothetical protein